jgi:hypothetical protein
MVMGDGDGIEIIYLLHPSPVDRPTISPLLFSPNGWLTIDFLLTRAGKKVRKGRTGIEYFCGAKAIVKNDTASRDHCLFSNLPPMMPDDDRSKLGTDNI